MGRDRGKAESSGKAPAPPPPPPHPPSTSTVSLWPPGLAPRPRASTVVVCLGFRARITQLEQPQPQPHERWGRRSCTEVPGLLCWLLGLGLNRFIRQEGEMPKRWTNCTCHLEMLVVLRCPNPFPRQPAARPLPAGTGRRVASSGRPEAAERAEDAHGVCYCPELAENRSRGPRSETCSPWPTILASQEGPQNGFRP